FRTPEFVEPLAHGGFSQIGEPSWDRQGCQRQLPNPRDFVVSSRRHPATIRTKGGRNDLRPVWERLAQGPARPCFQDLQRVIGIAERQLAVGAELAGSKQR